MRSEDMKDLTEGVPEFALCFTYVVHERSLVNVVHAKRHLKKLYKRKSNTFEQSTVDGMTLQKKNIYANCKLYLGLVVDKNNDGVLGGEKLLVLVGRHGGSELERKGKRRSAC